jgi:predicted Fe-Mo cluster-binding NifX family protein
MPIVAGERLVQGDTMRIAVASQDFKTVSGHAGRARRFLLFQTNSSGEPIEFGRLELPDEMTFHQFDPEGVHPLDFVQVVIAAGAGAGYVHHMAVRGVRVVTTSETDAHTAAQDFLNGRLKPAVQSKLPIAPSVVLSAAVTPGSDQ